MKQTSLLQHLLTAGISGTLRTCCTGILVLLFACPLQAQTRNCISHDLLKHQLETNPAYAKSRQRLEEFTRDFVTHFYSKDNNTASRTGLITIPVVFHVIHYGQAIGTGTNISNAQLNSQIQVLNEDYRRLNADKKYTPLAFQNVAADCEIEFCIALQDPQGNPALGVNRINGGRASWDYNQMEALKPTLAWDPNRYLNIYVADISPIGALGYSTFPVSPLPLNDGIVCDYRTIGRYPANPYANFYGGAYNLGRTATHEVGHWLNLFHIWGDDGTACTGTDMVYDTPNQGGPNAGCPVFPKQSCNNLPNGDMFMNFMDYTNDACLNMFSTGQKARMSATLDNIRTQFAGSVLCQRVFTATNITAYTATLNWSPYMDALSYTVYWRPVGTNGAWTTAATVNSTLNIGGLAPYPAAYEWQVQPVYANGAGANSASQLFRTMAAAPAFNCPNDPNETAIFGPYLASGTTAAGIICPAADVDRFVIMNTMPGTNSLRLILSNLFLDYDIELRDAATNTLLAAAASTGTVNDTIRYTGFLPGNYYVYVYAKAPAMVNVQPYQVSMRVFPGTTLPPGMRTIAAPDREVSIFPNPASDYASLNFGSYEGPSIVRFTDVSGRTVKTISAEVKAGERTDIDLSDLPRGLYFVTFFTGETTQSQKLMIQ